ncbi:hypothetical protein VP01_2313g1 [Puccinia sorghi]|uniref:Uncharacterized protein n=1 Tax=Puccinia sorghi TaxID=27349 RepID=A0A0L6V7M6_9BASI|nr:hypothetical protein VP01_2313g1 [Puccinia sorghi]
MNLTTVQGGECPWLRPRTAHFRSPPMGTLLQGFSRKPSQVKRVTNVSYLGFRTKLYLSFIKASYLLECGTTCMMRNIAIHTTPPSKSQRLAELLASLSRSRYCYEQDLACPYLSGWHGGIQEQICFLPKELLISLHHQAITQMPSPAMTPIYYVYSVVSFLVVKLYLNQVHAMPAEHDGRLSLSILVTLKLNLVPFNLVTSLAILRLPIKLRSKNHSILFMVGIVHSCLELSPTLVKPLGLSFKRSSTETLSFCLFFLLVTSQSFVHRNQVKKLGKSSVYFSSESSEINPDGKKWGKTGTHAKMVMENLHKGSKQILMGSKRLRKELGKYAHNRKTHISPYKTEERNKAGMHASHEDSVRSHKLTTPFYTRLSTHQQHPYLTTESHLLYLPPGQ